jgi:hypothetical protein
MAIRDAKDDIQVRQPEPVRLCFLVARASVNPAGEILKLANIRATYAVGRESNRQIKGGVEITGTRC